VNSANLRKLDNMNKAVEVAMKYVGQKELPNNVFDPETDFGKKMKAVGHQDGNAWCALFCELVFKEAYPEKFKDLDRLFSASAVQTFTNFTHKEKGAGFMQNGLPKEGNLVIWQTQKDGKPQWTGHAGIVKEVKSDWEFTSIEGNTNDLGGREGVTVAIKERKVLKDVWNGLRILGFIQIA
jgi:hypothetical protein